MDFSTFSELIRSRAELLRSVNRTNPVFIREYLTQLEPKKRYSESSSRPLFGSLFAVKDCIRVSGSEVSFGMKPPYISQSLNSAAVVELFESLGATLVGSTNLDEACLSFWGDNRNYGRMLNPLDLERSPAGSSGGSGIAVASGIVDFALGTDIGGSMRAPAAATAICGLMCGKWLLPTEGIISLAPSLDFAGIFGCTPQKIKEVLLAVPASKTKAETKITKIVLPSYKELADLEPSYAAAFESLIQKARNFVEVTRSDRPVGLEQSRAIRKILAAHEISAQIESLGIKVKDLPSEGRAVRLKASNLSDTQIAEAQASLKQLREQSSELIVTGAMLMVPTLPAPPPRWLEIANDTLPNNSYMGRFLALPNLIDAPTLSIPVPTDPPNKIPLSVQFMGQPGSEFGLLELGIKLSAAIR